MSAIKVPVPLLLNGVVIAAHTLMAKQAYSVGVTPIVYALASAAGAAGFLFLVRLAQRQGWRLTKPQILYGLVAGLISVAVPQVLIYSASAYMNAGIASLAYAFPTPLTYVLASLFGLERMSAGRTLGVGIAFAGAAGLAVTRSAGPSSDAVWIVLAMLAPLAIASGNIYRARFWPEGSRPLDLAIAMTASGAFWLAGALAISGGFSVGDVAPMGFAYLAAASAVAAFGNVIYFELQRSGGIVSFSQIGYVGAVIGLAGGALILGERYSGMTWVAALVIAAGVVISEAFKRWNATKEATPQPRSSNFR
jgi:drug/metabolite transporter (DMT)-like permease